MSITASIAFQSVLELGALQQLVIDNLSQSYDHGPFTTSPTRRTATWGFYDADQNWICDVKALHPERIFGIRANYGIVVNTSRRNFQQDKRPLVLTLLHDLIVNRNVVTEAIYTCDEPILEFKDGAFYANLTDLLWSTVVRCFVGSEVVSDKNLFIDDPYRHAYENLEALVAYDNRLLDYRDDRGSSLFDLAVIYGDLKSLEFLCYTDIPIESDNSSGDKALILAAGGGNTDVIRFLVGHGFNINAPGAELMTPLMKASARGWTDCVAVLLSLGADINRRSVNGETALTLAMNSQHFDIVEALLPTGANRSTD